jgi:hypothetical protein
MNTSRSSLAFKTKSVQTCVYERYNASFHLHQMNQLTSCYLSENQFAQLLGKCRMYNFLPYDTKKDVPQLLLGDSQINAVCKDYYKDSSFCRDEHGNINLWRVYNLLTSANKSTYIDNFLDRSANCYLFVERLRLAIQQGHYNWFLN